MAFSSAKRRGRISLRDTLEATNKADRFLAAMAGVPPRAQSFVPPKRDRIRRTSDDKPAMPLEREVLAAALEALRLDPRVALVDRRQSGVFQEGERFIRVGTRGTLDVSGMLKGGRYFEIEAKRPGEKPDPRQALRIAHIREQGGISGFFTSADEALALLP